MVRRAPLVISARSSRAEMKRMPARSRGSFQSGRASTPGTARLAMMVSAATAGARMALRLRVLGPDSEQELRTVIDELAPVAIVSVRRWRRKEAPLMAKRARRETKTELPDLSRYGRLADYNPKRHFPVTPEPPGRATERAPGHPRGLVIQNHRASPPHSDFRLEHRGV